MRLHVLDLDGSVAEQAPIAARVLARQAGVVDLRKLGPALRVIATRRGIAQLVAILDEQLGLPGSEPALHFYGSGDFHHVTAALVSRVREPVTIIQFDNHPDWCRFPPTFNCGGWVSRALAMPHVERIVTLGPASAGDFVRPELQTADLASIAAGRLEVYPWQADPSRVFRRYADAPCWQQSVGHLHWRNLADVAWPDFLDELSARLPQTALWITIDKDVLGPGEATTNWDQGAMPLAHVLTAIERLGARRRIVGVDICGEYSQPEFSDPIRAFLARLDNPPGKPPSAAQLAINAETNGKLIEVLEAVLGESARSATDSSVARDGRRFQIVRRDGGE